MKSCSQSSVCAVLAAALALVPGSAWPGEENPVVQRMELRITQRQLQDGNKTRRVTQGQAVEMVWTSDEAGKLHLHGYDIEFEVSPEAPTVVTFKAHATGRFPVTSHGFGDEHAHGHEALLYLEVYPD
jgi:hypothetical protein